MSLGHGNIGLPEVHSIRGKYKISLVTINTIEYKIKTFNRSWQGNPMGFYYWVNNGSRKYCNFLTRDAVLEKIIFNIKNKNEKIKD